MPIRGSKSVPTGNYNFDGDPNWISGSTYGTGLDFMHSDNPMYEAYYAANPYVNQTYNKTFIDKAFGGIFRTSYDKWLNEMQLNAAQYNAGVVDLEQQTLYNSEVAKAQRMRDAGENPDLLGTGDVSESAGLKPDVQDAQIPDAVDLSGVASFAGMISQCFTGALGMASAGIDLIGKLSQIDNQNIQNAGGMQDLALQFIRNSIPAEGLETDADYNSWKEKLLALSTPDVLWHESLARSLGLKKNQRKAFDFALNNAVGNLPSEFDRFKMMDEYASNKISSARKTSSSFYDQSFEVMKGLSSELVASRDQLESLVARVSVLEQDVKEQNLNNEMTEGFIQEQYLDEKLKLGVGRTQAITENEDLNLKKIQQSIDRTLKNTRKSILNMLEGYARGGNDFAQYMIYNMMLHDYMNFEFKSKGEFSLGKHLPSQIKGWLPNLGADVEFGASM